MEIFQIVLCVLILVVPSACIFLAAAISGLISLRQQREQERREFQAIRELMF
jgi:cell division protein FtsB